MVRIINGEIVQDDDPKLRQRASTSVSTTARPPGSTAAAASGGVAGFQHGFDWSAPAVKVVPRPDAAGGIPDVELFGLRVPGVGLLGVAAAGAFFGLKGLLAAAVFGYVYLRSTGGASGPTAAPTAGTAADNSSGFLRPQHGFGGGGPQDRQGAAHAGPSPGSSTFKGKAYKLGGS